MGAGAAREACSRRMLLGFAAAGGLLDAGVRELAEGRAYNLQPYRRPLPPYPEAAWGRLTQAAERAVDTAYRAHRDALAGAGRGQDPATGGCELDNLRWLLARTGPMTVFDLAARLEISVETADWPSGSSGRAVRAPGRDRRLRAAVQRLLRHRPGRYRRSDHGRHRLGRGRHDPVVVCEGPHLGREPDPAQAGGPAVGAVAGALQPAARLRPRAGTGPALARGAPTRPFQRDRGPGSPERHPPVAGPPRRCRRQRPHPQAAPAPAAHHARVDAGAEHMEGQPPGHDRPQPQSPGGRRPLPDPAGPAPDRARRRADRPPWRGTIPNWPLRSSSMRGCSTSWSAANGTCSPRPAPINCPDCTAPRANRARPAPVCVCLAPSPGPRPATHRTWGG